MSLEEELHRLELQTLDHTVRSDPPLMHQLLSDEFFEFGESGKRWNRVQVLQTLASRSSVWERTDPGWRMLFHQGTRQPN